MMMSSNAVSWSSANSSRLILVLRKRSMGFSVPNKPTEKCVEAAKASQADWNQDPSIATSALTFVIGAFTGGLGSLVGLGGSIFAVPILMAAFRMPQSIANGTSMAAVVATAGGSVYCAFQNTPSSSQTPQEPISWEHMPKLIGDVHILNALCISLTASVMAGYGAGLSKSMSPKQLKMAFGAFLLTVGPLVPLKNYLKSKALSSSDATESKETNTTNSNKATLIDIVEPLALGVASGAIAGLFGAGGGLVLVPALTLFTDCGYKVALGTSFAVMLPTSISGATAHFRQGTMAVKYAAPLSVGCLAGSVMGSRYGKNVDEHYLSMGFSALILGLGVRTLQQAIRMV